MPGDIKWNWYIRCQKTSNHPVSYLCLFSLRKKCLYIFFRYEDHFVQVANSISLQMFLFGRLNMCKHPANLLASSQVKKTPRSLIFPRHTPGCCNTTRGLTAIIAAKMTCPMMSVRQGVTGFCQRFPWNKSFSWPHHGYSPHHGTYGGKICSHCAVMWRRRYLPHHGAKKNRLENDRNIRHDCWVPQGLPPAFWQLQFYGLSVIS